MNTPRATVSKLLTFSCVDGPGNRLVLFLQGCNFACLTCHNPHTMGHCTHCGDCVPACHAEALSMQSGRIVFDPALCDQCDDCLHACPINANPMVQCMDVVEVLDCLRENQAFLDGITLSGGEATTQLKFIAALFQAIKEDSTLDGLTCMIDSNGHLAASGWERVLPWTDGVMLDIKAIDSALHRRLSGVGNGRVLESARLLHRAGRLQELRYLVVPGLTDTEAETRAFIELVLSLDPSVPIRLNAFRTHGVIGAAADWPVASRATVEAIADRLKAAGIETVNTPVLYT